MQRPGVVLELAQEGRLGDPVAVRFVADLDRRQSPSQDPGGAARLVDGTRGVVVQQVDAEQHPPARAVQDRGEGKQRRRRGGPLRPARRTFVARGPEGPVQRVAADPQQSVRSERQWVPAKVRVRKLVLGQRPVLHRGPTNAAGSERPEPRG